MTVLVFSVLTLLVASVDHLVKAHNFLELGPAVVPDRYDHSRTKMQERLETGLYSERWDSVDCFYRRPAVSRPSKVMSKAWSAAFQRMVQRLLPVPLGSRLITAR